MTWNWASRLARLLASSMMVSDFCAASTCRACHSAADCAWPAVHRQANQMQPRTIRIGVGRTGLSGDLAGHLRSFTAARRTLHPSRYPRPPSSPVPGDTVPSSENGSTIAESCPPLEYAMRPTMLALLLTLALPAAAPAQVANLHSGAITAAVQKGVDDPAREADRHDDARRKVALVMTFAQVKPGQKVLELVPGSGYWT